MLNGKIWEINKTYSNFVPNGAQNNKWPDHCLFISWVLTKSYVAIIWKQTFLALDKCVQVPSGKVNYSPYHCSSG